MDINRLILILCLYQTVRCIYVAKDNDGEAASGRGTKSGGHDNTEENPTSQDIGLKYLDSLVQNIINHVPPVINVRGQRQREEYITDLRDKYASIVDRSTEKIILQEENGKDYSDNDSWRPEDRPFNRTTAWLRHTALRRLFLNTQSKCIQRIFNSTEISVNVERRAGDFYLWAIIPQKGEHS
uniref:Astacin domain-containing protein n=1 Tax=Elaeophora elaphi TaxID=1147741 RepID=A0A0R3RXA8_9BILA